MLSEDWSHKYTDNLDMDRERLLLLHHLSEMLPVLQQDPSPATSLVRNLIHVPDFSFQKVLNIVPKIDFVAGLKSGSSAINSITVDLLEKAKHDYGDLGILSSMNEVVQLLVQQLLLTDDIELHLKIQKLLEDTLVRPEYSSQLMWRRIFGDRNIYHNFFWICSLGPRRYTNEHDCIQIPQYMDEKKLGEKKRTIAQSRLLALLAKIDDPRTRQSHHLDIEKAYGSNNLLDFAVNRMINYQRDVLMHLTLIEFFSDWLRESAWHERTFSDEAQKSSQLDVSPALYYMQASGLHGRTASYYHSPTDTQSFDSRALYSQAGRYLETYYYLHPRHALEKLPYLLNRTLIRISMTLQESASAEFQSRPPYDLKLMVALPRAALLLQEQHRSGETPVYLHIPRTSNSAAVFETLASLFDGRHVFSIRQSGREQPRVTHPKGPAAARALYFLYLRGDPLLWNRVVQAAETLALKESAVAANNLIRSFINAEWEKISDDSFSNSGPEPMYYVKSERHLSDICGKPLPPSPALAILSSPALENVIPYLLRPAQTSMNLGIGGKGDTLNTANDVAAIRFDALSSLHRKLSEYADFHGEETGWGEILDQMKKRLDQGRWGGSSGGMYPRCTSLMQIICRKGDMYFKMSSPAILCSHAKACMKG